MSNHVNEQILEGLMDEVSAMDNAELARKFGRPWTADDLATPEIRATVEEIVVNRMFEQLPEGPQ